MPHTNKEVRAHKYRQARPKGPPKDDGVSRYDREAKQAKPRQPGRGKKKVIKEEGTKGRKRAPSLKNQIRSLRRILAKGAAGDDQRLQLEAKIAELEALGKEHERREKERLYCARYHKVKFFEKKKVARRLARCYRRLEECEEPDQAALAADKERLEGDLKYVVYFPRDEKYIGLLTSTGDDSKTEARRASLRAQALLASSRDGDKQFEKTFMTFTRLPLKKTAKHEPSRIVTQRRIWDEEEGRSPQPASKREDLKQDSKGGSKGGEKQEKEENKTNYTKAEGSSSHSSSSSGSSSSDSEGNDMADTFEEGAQVAAACRESSDESEAEPLQNDAFFLEETESPEAAAAAIAEGGSRNHGVKRKAQRERVKDQGRKKRAEGKAGREGRGVREGKKWERRGGRGRGRARGRGRGMCDDDE